MQSIAHLPRIQDIGLLGSLGPSMRDQLALQRRLARQSVSMVRGRILHLPVIFPCTPEAAHEVLVTKAKSFEKAPGVRILLHDFAGQGLFTSEGAIWKSQRKLMSPLFQPAPIHQYAETMRLVTERVADGLHGGQSIDVARETTRIAMSIVGKALFDVDTFDEADELGRALTTALHFVNDNVAHPVLVAHVLLLDTLNGLAERTRGRVRGLAEAARDKVSSPFLLPGVRDPKLLAAAKLVDDQIQAMIDERRRRGFRDGDLLTRLMTARDQDGQPMSDRQVRHEAVTIFVAGHETTATALAWSFYLLSRHPDVLARVRAEADAFGDEPIAKWEPERLAYTTRVFREVMRLYAPLPMMARRTLEDVEISGVLLPKRTLALVSTYAQHYRAESYPDPERFDPDRWLPEREAERHRASYLPFSAGPRFCIGIHFAMMEGPIVLSRLLRRFDFEIDPNKTIVEDDFPTLRPRGGVPAIVRSRRPHHGSIAPTASRVSPSSSSA